MPFIPSTCLILANTPGITMHVRIKNRSIKVLSASTFPTPSYRQFIQAKHFALPLITLLKVSVFTNPAFINYCHSTTRRVRALHFHRQPIPPRQLTALPLQSITSLTCYFSNDSHLRLDIYSIIYLFNYLSLQPDASPICCPVTSSNCPCGTVFQTNHFYNQPFLQSISYNCSYKSNLFTASQITDSIPVHSLWIHCVQLFHYSTVPLFHYSTILLFHCSTIPQFYCSTIPQFIQ